MIEEVSENKNATRGMVHSVIIEYRRSAEVLNDLKIESGIGVNSEREMLYFTTKLSWYWGSSKHNGIKTRSETKSNTYHG